MTAPQDLRKKLNGVIAFPVTPFKKNLSLDLPGLRGNLQSLLKHPVAAVIAAAGTGEIYSLSVKEHLEVVETTLSAVGGRVPVLAGAGFNLPFAVELAQQSARAGVDGILAFPPSYPHADEQGLFEYYKVIGEATCLGLIIYSRDWFNPGIAAVRQLTKIPTLIAWKDGQGDVRRYQILKQSIGDALHWIGGAGDDLVPAYYSMGIRTYTSSIANVAPKLSLQLHEAAANHRYDELQKLMEEYVIPLYAFRNRRKGYEVSVMKTMMDLLGLAGGMVRPPLLNVQDADLAELRQMTEKWRPLLTPS